MALRRSRRRSETGGLTRGRWLAIVAAIAIGVGIGAFWHLLTSDGDGPPALVRAVSDSGIGGPIRLTDTEGRERNDAEFRGKLMLVEFGYTFCPDVCPLGLQLFADVLDKLGPAADQVQPIFITVDPTRDTPDVLRSYVEHFSPRILALTGTDAQIAEVARAYRVYYKLGADRATNPNYVVEHSAILYVMGRDGRFLTHFTHDMQVDRVVATLRAALTPMAASGIIIAAASSGAGKTTVTFGLLRALRDRGLRVAAAKAGPDYIDPSYHAAATGRPCFNLDPWAMRPGTLTATVARLAQDAEFVICEGVMGLYDGIDPSGTASTADLAARTGWPVVLVVNAQGLAASAAALVAGYNDPPGALGRFGVRIAGVIFNRVGSSRHADVLSDAVREALPEVAILGAIPRHAEMILPERHLGLVPAAEEPNARSRIDAAARLIGDAIDLEQLQSLARPAAIADSGLGMASVGPLGQRLAVARDDAFVFTYPALLETWRRDGAAITFFSPLEDQPAPPDSNAIYLPGGYPELHAGRLAAARGFHASLEKAARRGTTIYGECGGYMVLGRYLTDAAGHRHAMTGLLPLETSFAARRLHLGYRQLRLTAAGPLGGEGAAFRGHEFHYASILDEGAGAPLFAVTDAGGRQLPAAGRRQGSVMGSFVHLIDRAAN